MEETEYRKVIMNDSRANWAVWFLVAICVLLAFGIVNSTSATYKHRLLIVQLADDNNKASEVDVVRQALVRGGWIVLNADIARSIDPSFEEQFAVSDSKSMFLTLPAILNWLGDDSW